jgi:hypothetical protein
MIQPLPYGTAAPEIGTVSAGVTGSLEFTVSVEASEPVAVGLYVGR